MDCSFYFCRSVPQLGQRPQRHVEQRGAFTLRHSHSHLSLPGQSVSGVSHVRWRNGTVSNIISRSTNSCGKYTDGDTWKKRLGYRKVIWSLDDRGVDPSKVPPKSSVNDQFKQAHEVNFSSSLTCPYSWNYLLKLIVFVCCSFFRFLSQDYKTYLDFVLALENRKEPAALQYIFKLLDMENQGYLNVFSLNYFFRVLAAHTNIRMGGKWSHTLKQLMKQDDVFGFVFFLYFRPFRSRWSCMVRSLSPSRMSR